MTPRPRRLLIAVVVLLLTGLGLLWWAATAPTTPTPDTASVARTSPATAPVTPNNPTPVPAPDTASADVSTPITAAGPAGEPSDGDPRWSIPTSSQAAAAQASSDAHQISLATAFAEAFARPGPGVDRAAWWARVEPLMAPGAAADYVDVDPARVRFTRVTGRGAVVEPPADVVDYERMQVGVPTDGGWYLVTLDLDGKATKITPIGDVQDAS